jgi:hypothetical protein
MQDNSYKNIVFLSKLKVLHVLRNRKYSKIMPCTSHARHPYIGIEGIGTTCIISCRQSSSWAVRGCGG